MVEKTYFCRTFQICMHDLRIRTHKHLLLENWPFALVTVTGAFAKVGDVQKSIPADRVWIHSMDGNAVNNSANGSRAFGCETKITFGSWLLRNSKSSSLMKPPIFSSVAPSGRDAALWKGSLASSFGSLSEIIRAGLVTGLFDEEKALRVDSSLFQ